LDQNWKLNNERKIGRKINLDLRQIRAKLEERHGNEIRVFDISCHPSTPLWALYSSPEPRV
jgi:hypothetical protein